MSKHTPGPWVASEMMGNRRITIKGGLSSVAVVSVGNVDHFANARLIAAAPELLEALRDIADDYADRFDMDSPSTNPGIKDVVQAARAAIAKATGGNDE